MNPPNLPIDMVHQDDESFENQWALKVKFLITDLGYLAVTRTLFQRVFSVGNYGTHECATHAPLEFLGGYRCAIP